MHAVKLAEFWNWSLIGSQCLQFRKSYKSAKSLHPTGLSSMIPVHWSLCFANSFRVEQNLINFSSLYRSKFCSVCIIIFWLRGWVWLPPVPFSYVNWADGEPNNWSEQDCVQILPVWAHKWDDDFCNYHKKAVCEKNGEMVLQML